MRVGERIKRRRLELNMRADDLANALGVSRSTIFRYENGGIEKVPIDVIPNMANALKLSPAELMGWSDDENTEIKVLDVDLYISDKEKKYAPILNVAAGAFHDDISQLDEEIEIPERWEHLYGKLFAIRVLGESMNKVLPNGAIVLCEDVTKSGYSIKNGDFVVFEHDGEYTVKKLIDTSSMVILDPCSYDDSFEPIVFTKNEELDLKILGVVRRCFIDFEQ